MTFRLLMMIVLPLLAVWTRESAALEIKDVTFSTENAGTVTFKHAAHMKKKRSNTPNISCKACHNQNMVKGQHYTMAQMEQGQSCGQCHDGKKAFALAKCTGCHKVRDVTYKIRQTGQVKFRHTTHLGKKQECGTCHNGIFKTSGNPAVTMKDMEKGISCGACHNGKKAFSLASCITCHPVRDINYAVKGAGKVVFSHTGHLAFQTCNDCHGTLYNASRSKAKVSMAEMEKGSSCGACHDGKTAFTVKEHCATCHKM